MSQPKRKLYLFSFAGGNIRSKIEVKRKSGASDKTGDMASTATLNQTLNSSEMPKEGVTAAASPADSTEAKKQTTPGGGKRKLTPLPVSQPVKDQNSKVLGVGLSKKDVRAQLWGVGGGYYGPFHTMATFI